MKFTLPRFPIASIFARTCQRRSTMRCMACVLMLGWVSLSGYHAKGAPQDDGPEDSNPDQFLANQTQELPFEELPKIPDDLDPWVQKGRVRFVVGGPQPNRTDRAESTGSAARRGGAYSRPRTQFDAETNFKVHLDYRTNCRWRVRNMDGQRHLIISIRYSRVKLEPVHTVWFRRRIPPSRFWDSPLVRHEFDHVKISTLVADTKRFTTDLREHATLDLIIENDAPVHRQMVLGLVDQHVNQRFQQLIDLIEIRYQELDRQTRHGRQPLPANSDLQPLLGEDIPVRAADLSGTENRPSIGNSDVVGAGEDR